MGYSGTLAGARIRKRSIVLRGSKLLRLCLVRRKDHLRRKNEDQFYFNVFRISVNIVIKNGAVSRILSTALVLDIAHVGVVVTNHLRNIIIKTVFPKKKLLTCLHLQLLWVLVLMFQNTKFFRFVFKVVLCQIRYFRKNILCSCITGYINF